MKRIIHQTWKSDNIPSYYQKWIHSWKENHSEWDYMFWSDNDLRDFISTNYNWFIKTYDGYSKNIMRVDAARYFLLYHYGGLYVDMDVECYRAIDDLIYNKCVLFREYPDDFLQTEIGSQNIITNSIMYSDASSPLFKMLVNSLDIKSQQNISNENLNVIYTTGPMFLTLKGRTVY